MYLRNPKNLREVIDKCLRGEQHKGGYYGSGSESELVIHSIEQAEQYFCASRILLNQLNLIYHLTTYREFQAPRENQDCWIRDPLRPPGAGWRMVGSDCYHGFMLWYWERDPDYYDRYQPVSKKRLAPKRSSLVSSSVHRPKRGWRQW